MKSGYGALDKALRRSIYFRKKSEMILENIFEKHDRLNIFVGLLQASGAKIISINNYAQLKRLFPKVSTGYKSLKRDNPANPARQKSRCVHVSQVIWDLGVIGIEKEAMISLELSGHVKNKKFVIDARRFSSFRSNQEDPIYGNAFYYISGPKEVLPNVENPGRRMKSLSIYVLSIDNYPDMLSDPAVCPICLHNLK